MNMFNKTWLPFIKIKGLYYIWTSLNLTPFNLDICLNKINTYTPPQKKGIKK